MTIEVACLKWALRKMLKHGRAGVPMEVMGLMLGEFIDDYTVRVVDVFSMPQSGNSVSVEAKRMPSRPLEVTLISITAYKII